MKERLGEDINISLNSFLQRNVDEQYNESYLGVVEDNNDPLKIGRVRVRIHGLYDDIPTNILPWSTPNFPLGAGGIKGSFIVPDVGAIINVQFDDGDIYEPKYDTKCLDTKNLNFEADKDQDYPNSVIFYETEQGDYFKINKKRGEYIIKTGAGVFFKFCENGDITLSNESSEDGALNLTINGNIVIDNRYSNYFLYTNKLSTSAFGDISTKSNGGIVEECLDNKETYANHDINSIAGNNTSIKSKERIDLGSKKLKVRTNDIDIKPSMPGVFNYSVCADEVQAPFISVTPSSNGGPFNCLMFDPMTGAPHQGREMTAYGVTLSMKDTTEESIDIAEITAEVSLKYGKILSESISNIIAKYTSIDSQAQMLLQNINGDNLLNTMKADEISNTTSLIMKAQADELKLRLENITGYLTTPIFKEEELNRAKYKQSLVVADTLAKADITGKTKGKDIIGPGDGLVVDVNFGNLI